MAHHSSDTPQGKANVARARDTLVPGDVVVMNMDTDSNVTRDFRNLIVLIVANGKHRRSCKIIGRDNEIREFALHSDWQKIGHIDQWAEMVKP